MRGPLEALRRDGFSVLRDVGADAFERLLAEVGEVVVRTSVELRREIATHLCRSEAVPLHTDHPDIDVVGWWCERQDEHDGASLLVDTNDVLEGFSRRERELFSRVLLPCPALRAISTARGTEARALLSPAGDIYFAEWLAPKDADQTETWRLFAAGASSAPRRIVRLAPGDALLVDNHRVLHGRGPLQRESRRRLRRAWVVMSEGARTKPEGAALRTRTARP